MLRPLMSGTCIGVLRENRDDTFEVEWLIDGFLSLLGTVNKLYTSPTFRFSDSTWSLFICLHGEEENNSADHIALFLWREDPSLPEIVTCNLSVKRADGSLISKKMCTWKFYQRHEHGCPCILNRSELLKCKFLSSDALTIVCVLKKPSPPQDQNTICAGLKDILASKELCDVTIHVGQQVFDAHKVILAASSPVFSAMFRNEMSEKNSGTVTITDCDPESFQDFLSYLYTGRADITPSNVSHLYKTAHKYRVEELISHCVAFMMENASVDNICHFAALGDMYSDDDLRVFFVMFFRNNFQGILRTSEWELLMKENYRMANDVLKTVTSMIRIEW